MNSDSLVHQRPGSAITGRASELKKENGLGSKVLLPVSLLLKLPIRSLYHTSSLKKGDEIELNSETRVYLRSELRSYSSLDFAEMTIVNEQHSDKLELVVCNVLTEVK
jgi:hypothetical protein